MQELLGQSISPACRSRWSTRFGNGPFRALKALVKGCGLWLPQYLTRGAAKISLLLCLTMLAMMTARNLRGMAIVPGSRTAWMSGLDGDKVGER